MKKLCILFLLFSIPTALFAFDSDAEALQYIKDTEFDFHPQDILWNVVESIDREAPGYGRHDSLTLLDYRLFLNDAFSYHRLRFDRLNFDGISFGLEARYLDRDTTGMFNIFGNMTYFKSYFDDYFDDFNLFLKIMNPAPLFLLAWLIDLAGGEDYITDGISNVYAVIVKGSDLDGWSEDYYTNSLRYAGLDADLNWITTKEDLEEIYFLDVINYDFLRLRHFSLGLGWSYLALLNPIIESLVGYSDETSPTRIYGNDVNSIFRSFYFDLNLTRITADILQLSFLERILSRYHTTLLAFVEKTYRNVDVTSLGLKLFSFPLAGKYLQFDGRLQSDMYTGEDDQKTLMGKLSLVLGDLTLAASLARHGDSWEEGLYDYGVFLDWDLGYSLGGVLSVSARMQDSATLVPGSIRDPELSVSLRLEG